MTETPNTDEAEVKRIAVLCRCKYARERGSGMVCVSCLGPMGEERARAAIALATPSEPSA